MHDAPMWPSHEQYECRTCGRWSPVPWTKDRKVRRPAVLRAFKEGERRIAA